MTLRQICKWRENKQILCDTQSCILSILFTVFISSAYNANAQGIESNILKQCCTTQAYLGKGAKALLMKQPVELKVFDFLNGHGEKIIGDPVGSFVNHLSSRSDIEFVVNPDPKLRNDTKSGIYVIVLPPMRSDLRVRWERGLKVRLG